MGTDRNRKRLEKVERSLMPREVVLSWIEEVLKFESHENYALWVAEEVTRAPLDKMLRQIRDGVAQCSGYREKHSSRELVRNRSSEMMFLFNLFMSVNRQVHGFVGEGNPSIAALEQSAAFIRERVHSATLIFELWKGLADTPYPLDAAIAAAASFAVKNDVTKIDQLVLEIADWQSNHSADQVANKKESESLGERIERAVLDLCNQKLIRRGWCVTLEPTAIRFLSVLPLVDGVWMDWVPVVLAEFTAALHESGIKLEPPADPHSLAFLQPSRARVVPGEQQAAALADETTDACAKAESRLSAFGGRTREIRGRLYIHIDDYRTWSERKAGGDLEVTEGVLTASWNASVEAKGDYPELPGIRECKLHPVLDEDDFFSCKNFLGRQQEREQRASRLRELISKLKLGSKEVRKLENLLKSHRACVCESLSRMRTVLTATERLSARYFPSRKILFKAYAKALKRLEERAGRLADDYNCLVDYIKSGSGLIFDARLASRMEGIDKDAAGQAPEEGVTYLVNLLITSARAEMLFSFNENEKATSILRPILKREIKARGAALNVSPAGISVARPAEKHSRLFKQVLKLGADLQERRS